MIRPKPGFLLSFDALEQSIRALPRQASLLPPPAAPDPAALQAWLRPYRDWGLPAVYLDFVARYGGAAGKIPPIGTGLVSVERLLSYRRKREAIGEVFRTRVVTLSPNNIDGKLCLVFAADEAPPRVGFFHGDDDVEYEADSFALYLWNSMFLLATIHEVRFSELISFGGVEPRDVGPFNLRLAGALRAGDFEVLGADSRILCGQREGTRFSITVRAQNISVSMANQHSHDGLMRAHDDMRRILVANRPQ